jgi:hypothetical protein
MQKNPLPSFDCKKYVMPTDGNVVVRLISNVNAPPPTGRVIPGRPPLRMVAVAFCAEAFSLARSGKRARAMTRQILRALAVPSLNFEFIFMLTISHDFPRSYACRIANSD